MRSQRPRVPTLELFQKQREVQRDTSAITIYPIAVPSRESGISEFSVSVYLHVCPLEAHEEVAFESRIGNE